MNVVHKRRYMYNKRYESRLKITDSRSPVMMTDQIFFSPDKPPILAGQINEYYNYFFALRWQQIVVRHCRSGFCRQVGEKFIHTLLSSFPRFSPVLCPFIYTFSIIVRRCRKSPRFILQMVFNVTSSNCKVKIARFYEFIFTLG